MSILYEMTEDEFIEKYKAIKNEKYGGYIFGDSNEEWEFIKKQKLENVWTWTSANDGDETEYLRGGIHKVNNLGQYYVTEVENVEYDDDEAYEVTIKIKEENKMKESIWDKFNNFFKFSIEDNRQ